MDKLFIGLQVEGVEATLDEVFDCLDVVVGGLLYLLYFKGIVVGEMEVDVAKLCRQTLPLTEEVVERQGRHRPQGDEIFYLDPDTVTDKGSFGEISGQRLGLGTITAVDWGDGIKTVHSIGIVKVIGVRI